MRKIARWKNHKRFNVRCIRHKITPTSISMITNVTGVRAQHIVKKAELQLLGVRIRQRTYTIKKLNEPLTTDKQQLEAILNSDEIAETERLLMGARKHTFEETRSRQQSKFERLYNKSQTKKEGTDTDIDTNRWVMNLSDRQISDDERSIYPTTPAPLHIPSLPHPHHPPTLNCTFPHPPHPNSTFPSTHALIPLPDNMKPAILKPTTLTSA